jgi:hypothetical protein
MLASIPRVGPACSRPPRVTEPLGLGGVLAESLMIEGRFRGPPDSANGGYAAGSVAGLIGGSAVVTLRAPPPLDTLLRVLRPEAGHVRVLHGETLVAEARRAEPHVDLPEPVDRAAAERASRDYIGFAWHPFGGCFTCGPERSEGDGLRIFPGAVPGSQLVAAPWTPAASLAGTDGRIRPAVVWAALDCPSYFGVARQVQMPLLALLGRITASITRPVRVAEPCVVLGWSLGAQGRKMQAASAVWSEERGFLAWAEATWIQIPKVPH